ncbi:MAG: hypothetical protein ACRDFX_09825 [Chloroflexota bacterium]
MDQSTGEEDPREFEARVVAMRDGGASWLEVERAFSLSRQQVRHRYQRGKRTERREANRGKSPG